MRTPGLRLVLAAMAAALCVTAAPARAGITIVNLDAPGEGFNDPTPAAPVGGNPGTTIGQQRLNLFQQAAGIWDAILGSAVEIRIEAAFDPLFCTATSAVLGAAGPDAIEANFVGAPFAGTWYTGAEANRLTGVDLQPAVDDIIAQFNSNLGNVGCLTGRGWYYGFDGNEGNNIDLLPVLLHEFGHGLGFLTLTDETDGSFLSGLPSIFDRFLMDDVTGKHWIEMTPAERVTSAIHSDHLVWDGPAVSAATFAQLGPRARVQASGALTADFVGQQANFGTPLTTGGFTAQVVVVNDGAGTLSDACETPFVNAGAVAGKIALIDRGICTLAQKAINAQANGAVGVLFVNNAASTTTGTISGIAPSVTIPIIGVNLADGNAIRTATGSGTVTLTIGLDAAHKAGANDAGLAMMFAPNPDQPGSSVSHFDVKAWPNKLMEPNINNDLTTDVDLTFELFFDIGWFPQLVGVPVAVEAPAFTLGPNPSREGGTLRFGLASASVVDVSIFDVAGRRIARFAEGRLPAGPHALAWGRRDERGNRVPAGVYLARLKTNGTERSTRIVLVD